MLLHEGENSRKHARQRRVDRNRRESSSVHQVLLLSPNTGEGALLSASFEAAAADHERHGRNPEDRRRAKAPSTPAERN
ncbi:hypothetical protein K0M31_008363 [Melipona bicolor]|uniref:Uncharacterized protein n=1 Tax=Melipona bicolor TaxID=60889 RepID=A0AA40FRG2_9HYME|nr:hypothetical protein K0M31_008363 [Melipona bicolor]